jgi:transposase
VIRLARAMHYLINTELSSHEETRFEFNRSTGAIKLGIDVHQDFYVVVEQVEGGNPKPPQRFDKQAFLHWASKLKQRGAEVHAVYEACGFGFSLQRNLTALGIKCHVVCPQKLDERNKRVKTDGLDAKALCLKLDRFVQGNRHALALVRVPTEEEEHSRAIHRQREQLVGARKRLEAQRAQFDGQSRSGPGAKLVEAAHVCHAPSATLDERAASKQPTHFASATGKDRRPHAATAKRCRSKPTAWTGQDDQRSDRSADW